MLSLTNVNRSSIPTVGFNMKKVQKGHVTLKWSVRYLPGSYDPCFVQPLTVSSSWDLGGQPRFRSMWERYCRNVNAIVYAENHKRPALY